MIEQKFAAASRFTFMAATAPELVENNSELGCVPIGTLQSWLSSNADAAKRSDSAPGAFSVVLTEPERIEEFRRTFGGAEGPSSTSPGFLDAALP